MRFIHLLLLMVVSCLETKCLSQIESILVVLVDPANAVCVCIQ